jgi:hypothetical protein
MRVHGDMSTISQQEYPSIFTRMIWSLQIHTLTSVYHNIYLKLV